MDIPQGHPVVALVVDPDCGECRDMAELLGEIVAENAETGLELMPVEFWDRPDDARELSAMHHPTAVLFVGGRERARLTGRRTKRQALRKFLPFLYPDPDEAVSRLRDQLASDADTFPSRRPDGFAPRSRRTKVDALRAVSLFAGLSRHELDRVARFTDEVPFVTGQVLATQGDEGDEFLILVEGAVEVRRNDRKLTSQGPGDHVGEMSLLDGEPRSATVIATSDGEALVVHRRDFDYLLDTVPRMARKLLANLSRRLRAADRRLVG